MIQDAAMAPLDTWPLSISVIQVEISTEAVENLAQTNKNVAKAPRDDASTYLGQIFLGISAKKRFICACLMPFMLKIDTHQVLVARLADTTMP